MVEGTANCNSQGFGIGFVNNDVLVDFPLLAFLGANEQITKSYIKCTVRNYLYVHIYCVRFANINIDLLNGSFC